MKPLLLLLALHLTPYRMVGEEIPVTPSRLESEFWHAGDEVFLDVEAQADVFLFGRDRVEIDGIYHQDLWAAGRRVAFRGVAHDDVRLAAAEFLTVDGKMTGGTLRAFSGQNLMIDTQTVVRGTSYLTASRNLTLNGSFTGNVTASGSRIIVAAQVDGDLTLRGGEITVMPGARITGTVFYSGERPPHLPKGVTDTVPVALDLPQSAGNPLAEYRWMIRAMQFFSSFVLGILLVRFLPRFTGNCVETVLKLQPQCMVLGFFTTLLLGFTGYFLMVSVLGLGAGLFLLIFLGLLLYSGKIILALALGALVVKHREPLTFFRLSLGLLLGLLLIYGAFSLPWIGSALWVIVSCWGMGAILHAIRNSQRVLKLEIPPNLRED